MGIGVATCGASRPGGAIRRKAASLAVLLLVIPAGSGGCRPPRVPYPQSFHSEAPEDRIAAIRRAVDTRDTAMLGLMVDRLEDEDEAVRFYAVLGLERLTGTRLGYDYADDAGQRRRAVARWRDHLARMGEEPAAASSPEGPGR